MSYKPTNAVIPPGIMRQFTGGTIPPGYLLCDGSAVSRTTYADLFTAIGTTWGAGNGSTTFNVPNMARRVPVGSGGSGTGTLGSSLGNTGGAETHTLSVGELATHAHGVTDNGHVHGLKTAVGGAPGSSYNVLGTSYSFDNAATGLVQNSTGTGGSGISINNNGSGAAHNNVQPSAVIHFIIKT